MPEYACFFHPLQKGDSLEALCAQCGRPLGFPLENHPTSINRRSVIKGLGRGFYGAVFQTKHASLDRNFAVKVIPKTTYASAENGGYGKSIDDEAQLHASLASTEVIAQLLDFGEEELQFGSESIACHWLEMEFVSGPTLDELILNGPGSPVVIAQIAWDLLDFVEAMQQQQRFHNDLHGENIRVTKLDESHARRNAIDPYYQVKVFDWGSAADQSKSGPQRQSDVHWVAQHIIQLLDSFANNTSTIEPTTLRLCAQLRRIAEIYFAKDKTRPPKPSDMKTSILSAYKFGIHPWRQPVRLSTVAEHYNSQTLPSWFAPDLFFDPDGRWARKLIGTGPQLLVGMRGCGKTILLRSLEWVARLHKRANESSADVIARASKDPFLALFVSCASLQDSPSSRGDALQRPIHRLFLAFSREIVRNLQICQLENVGEIHYPHLKSLDEVVATFVPWYDAPSNPSDPVAMEHAISRAFQNPPPTQEKLIDMNAHSAFTELVVAARKLVDIWSDKVFLFLLDDVSQRFLPSEYVSDLLSQLCLQSADFGFKISTESSTLTLSTPGGHPARSGRDFEEFDLGVEVLALLRSSGGTRFIEEVLRRRTEVTEALPPISPAEILGHQKLVDIARTVRNKPAKTPVYWGIEALAGICVGDIGDVLQIYTMILQRAGNVSGRIPPELQHKTMVDFSEQKLFTLAGRNPWLYSHAVAFAAASHRELKTSTESRLRQHSEIFVKIAPDDEELFPKILELIDAAVFVFTGGTPRTKTKSGKPFLQFKLAFRKVLGLTNRLPLAMRDRFELSAQNLAGWLETPSASKLKSGKFDATASHALPPHEETDATDALDSSQTDQVQLGLFAKTESHFNEDDIVVPRVLHTVETLESGVITELDLDWSDKHLVGAFGFEARSLGAWSNLIAVGCPKDQVTMLQYPDVGLAAQVIELIRKSSVDFQSYELRDHFRLADDAANVISRCGDRIPVIDTTSLTKALIYLLVLESLRAKSEVWVLHTCAETYIPPDEELRPVVEMLESKKFPEAFESLDAMIAGESGPYNCSSVGKQFRDPSQPSHLAAFVPLKHDRLAQILAEVPVESITAIAQVHSAGKLDSRCETSKYLAEYFVQTYGGSVAELSSLDHDGTFQLLTKLHREFSLDSGYNFEIALTGAKMHSVGAAMFASTALPASVYYSSPTKFNPEKFTQGTGVTRAIHLRKCTRPSPGIS